MKYSEFSQNLILFSQKNIDNFVKEDIHLISTEESIYRNLTLIDVRTSEEFINGRIPGAFNFPIFDNLERSQIGKIYKNLGKDAAVFKGLDFFKPKIKHFLLSLSFLKSKHLVVYCARGGMRSAAVVKLLQENGFSVSQMSGGYKEYRRFVLKELSNKLPPLIILHGKTGVGKTLLLKKLPNHLDLEDLAQHRSSLFGAIHKLPNTQKNFEAKLVHKLSNLSRNIHLFVEGESRKVGKVFIPEVLANAMQNGVFVLLRASIKIRIMRIIEEYQICDEKSIQQVDSILLLLRESLGKSKIEKMRWWLKRRELEKIVHMLLVDYYDPRYENSMKKYKFAMQISTEDLDQAVRSLISFRKELIKDI